MDLYELAGPVALGSRLRRLAARVAEAAPGIYRLYGSQLDPRWFPVVYSLAQVGPLSVGELAQAVGQSHAAVSQVVSAMRAAGLVVSRRSPEDGRKRVVALTEAGIAEAERLEPQLADVGAAVEELRGEMDHDIWEAVAELEQLLDREELLARVRRRFRAERIERVVIEPFAEDDAEAFERLNLAWIESHFEVEDADRETLGDPFGHVLDPGGAIFVARLDGEVIGTVAMIPMEEGCYELAKMAVSPHARGLGIGEQLGRAALDWARERGAPRVFLESNRRLQPALALYRKLGFVEVIGPPSPYVRADVQMELELG